jgi:hypothetical protein
MQKEIEYLLSKNYKLEEAKKMARGPSYDYPQDMIESGNYYDYRKAYLAGDKPVPNKHDRLYHWGSSGKSVNHPTAWKEAYLQVTGKNPDEHNITQGQGTEYMNNYHSLFKNKFLTKAPTNDYIFRKFGNI